MPDHELETPESPLDLYSARGGEVSELENRPVFTGDVFSRAGAPDVCVLQHPCAFRKGASLEERLLVAEVQDTASVPPDWAQGHFKSSFLPEFSGDGAPPRVVRFPRVEVLHPRELEVGRRLVIPSAYGVNLLIQRWLHHNSRVVVPTHRIAETTSGPHDEADLIMEALDELLAAGFKIAESTAWVDEWFSGEHRSTSVTRRDSLVSRQAASGVRADLRRAVAARVESL